MSLVEQIIARAKSNKQRIVLPEATEERTLRAADRVLAEDIADIILIGNPDEIHALAKEWGLENIDKATLIDPLNNPKSEEYAELLTELRKKKGMTIEKARELVKNPLYLGCMIIKTNGADGQISGALSTTGDTLRPARTSLTLERLMSMQGGLDYDYSAPAIQRVLKETGGDATTLQMAAAYAEKPLHFDPGLGFRYSLCHDVVGAILEAATGKPLHTLAEELVLRPLGIQGLTFHPSAGQLARLAPQYTVDAAGSTGAKQPERRAWRPERRAWRMPET